MQIITEAQIEEILQRVEEGMTTGNDADTLREYLARLDEIIAQLDEE